MTHQHPDRRRFNGKHAKGETNPNSKLTWEEVRKIRREYEENEGITNKKLADKYEVSEGTISAITSGRTWKEKV